MHSFREGRPKPSATREGPANMKTTLGPDEQLRVKKSAGNISAWPARRELIAAAESINLEEKINRARYPKNKALHTASLNEHLIGESFQQPYSKTTSTK
ncbi:MAG: hypothetical protein QXR24_05710 [Thermosphaera sp.]